MISKNLSRRLERLEAELAPNEEHVLKVTVTRIGEPDRVIEARLPQPDGRRRQPWQRNGGRGR